MHAWDLTTGAAAGAVAVLISMPFDCIKTYMQTHGTDLTGKVSGMLQPSQGKKGLPMCTHTHTSTRRESLGALSCSSRRGPGWWPREGRELCTTESFLDCCSRCHRPCSVGELRGTWGGELDVMGPELMMRRAPKTCSSQNLFVLLNALPPFEWHGTAGM